MGDQNYGLIELYAPPEGQEVKAQSFFTHSIVFVHGLFGHALNTWTTKRSDPVKEPICWPRSLLPPVIPNTKVFSYGYDANVDGFLSSAGQNTIRQNAQNLLSDLADLRNSPAQQEIPLIFVAHSLGGIVVKDALNQSSSTFGSRLKAIAPVTVGVCFLGTPHRGSKSASLGRMAYKCTVILTKRPNLRLLQGLERQSETLDRVGGDFLQTLLKHDISIRSFREERETRKYILFNILVVDADSAKIGNEKEEVGSIPADHSNMTKFGKNSDIGFKRVSSQLQRWVEGVGRHDQDSLDQQCQNLLDSLDDTATRARMSQVQHAHQQTFQWVFDPSVVSFNNWLRSTEPDDSPMYWIQGKPGSGKSTLMKYALNNDQLLQSLPAKDGSKWIIAAFFFHDRGSEIQKSLVGMFQQILGSILRQAPDLSRFALYHYRDLMKAQRTERPTWVLESLEAAMLSILGQGDVPVRIFLMLDALDEHHGDNDVLVTLLKSMVDNVAHGSVWLKLCLASRSWTVFQQHFRKCPGFAIHDHTQRDIRTYIEARLDVDEDALQREDGQIYKVRLIDHVAEKAFGVFIWVRLVMDVISKGARDGTPYPVLEEMASQMPQELEELYADTLRRVESDYSVEAYRMLQITLCSLFPLSIEDFVHVNFLNTDRPNHHTGRSKASQDAILGSSALLRNWIASRSGGLLEVSHRPSDEDDLQASDPESKSDPARIPKSTVQFIHQTVKDYILKSGPRNGLINIPQNSRHLNGNRCMLRSCGLHESTSHRIKKDVFVYARRAKVPLGSDTALVREAFLSYPPKDSVDWNVDGVFEANWDLDWFLKDRQGLFYDALRTLGNCEEAFWKLSAFEGLAQFHLESGVPEYPGLRDAFLVRALSTQEFEDPFDQSLSVLGWHHSWRDKWILEAIYTIIPVDNRFGITELGLCLLAEAVSEERRYSCLKALLEGGADLTIPIQPGYPSSHTPLSICVCQHSYSLVRVLLSYRAYSSPAEMSGDWDILRLATIRGNPDITQALLDAGFEDKPICNTSNQEDHFTQHLVASSMASAAAAGRTGSLARVQAWRS